MKSLKEKLLDTTTATLFRRARLHGIGSLSAQTAFFFILSLFPFIIFVNSLIALLNIPQESAISFLTPIFPDQIVSFLSNYLDTINSGGGISLVPASILLALFSSSKSVRGLTRAFDRAYGVSDKRGFFVHILFSVLFILILSFILIASIILVALGNDFITDLLLRPDIPPLFAGALSVWRWCTTSLIFFFAISIMYKLLPVAKVPFPETLPGTAFSLIGFLVLTGGFSFYVNNIASASAFYGSIGAVILFMLWTYFLCMILILGAELNKIVSDSRKSKKGDVENDSI